MAKAKGGKSKKPSKRSTKNGLRKGGPVTQDDDVWDTVGEDEFHRNRDTVFFEDGKRTSNGDDFDMENSDNDDQEEVFALNLKHKQEEESEAESDQEIEEDEEFEQEDQQEQETDDEDSEGEKLHGRFAKTAQEDSIHSSESESEEENERWGSYHATKKDTGEVDSEDEEALELEVAEAIRLQKLSRAKMSSASFGLESVETDQYASGTGVGKIEETSKKEEDSKEENFADLLRKNPETIALLDDFAVSAERLAEAKKLIKGLDQEEDSHALSFLQLEYQLLLSYSTALTFYFSLLLSPTPPSPTLLSNVLKRLAQFKAGLASMHELDLTSTMVDSDSDSENEEIKPAKSRTQLISEVLDEDELDEEEDMMRVVGSGSDDDDEDSEDDDGEDDEDDDGVNDAIEELLGDLTDAEVEKIMKSLRPEDGVDKLFKKVEQFKALKAGKNKRKRPSEDESESDSQEITTPKKTKKKNSGIKVPSLEPLKISTSSKVSRPVSDYIEQDSLSTHEKKEKAAHRHSLRFHVSQVHQKQQRREQLSGANGNGLSGDADIPLRSHERSRREVTKRQSGAGLSESEKVDCKLDDLDWDADDLQRAGKVKPIKANDDLEYYDLVKNSVESSKSQKKADYDNDRLTERMELTEPETVASGNPRPATRKILVNKGLSNRNPHSKAAKLNRNPRVKKRVQYDKKMKKLASAKSVYKGDAEAHSSYSGEKSGISTRVVKSRKF